MINFFISDLHLEESAPDIAAIFLRFLRDEAGPDRTLYILGDFFEAWIGDDDLTPFNERIIHALQQARQKGLQIFLMHGNRDFLLGKRFLRATQCQLLPDEHVIMLNGQPTLLMHGDTLCSDDKAYLRFRRKARNRLLQQLFFLRRSLKKRRQLAANMRAKSKAYTGAAPAYILDVTQETVEDVMQKHNVTHLIHGHTHRPCVHEFTIDEKMVKRTVLPAWHEHGSVLICDGQNMKMKMLTLENSNSDASTVML